MGLRSKHVCSTVERAILGALMMPSSPSSSRNPWGNADTPYEQIGGAEGVRQLAETFYDVIEEESPLIREMLPANTKKTRQKFFMYLSGWLGGPALYEEKWGHPRLRMRHFPFPIDETAATEWMRCMRQALDRVGIGGDLRDFLESRLAPLAEHMKNR
jgi:hemoglobin